VHRIRAFQWSQPANRKCADCSERGPTYICLTFQTFVCQSCSGIHRSFGHKIKGISLSEWSIKELESLEAGGNELAAQVWLAAWTNAEHPVPDSNQPEQMKEFIQQKYVAKRWWRQPKPRDTEADCPQPVQIKEIRAGAEAKSGSTVNSLLDTDGGGAVGLAPPPQAPSTAKPLTMPTVAAVVEAKSTTPTRAEAAKSEWTADFSSNTGPSPGLLDLDFGTAKLLGEPAPVLAEAGNAGTGAGSAGKAGLLDDLADLDLNGSASGKCTPAAPNKDCSMARVEPVCKMLDGLAGLDFNMPSVGSGASTPVPSYFDAKICGKPSNPLDLSSINFGANPLPATAAFAGGLGEPWQSSYVEPPLVEPAEEPAPAHAATGPKEELGTIGERMREAVLANSGDELKHLFRECMEPQKRVDTAASDRFAAFAAFDELCAGGGQQPEAYAQQQSHGAAATTMSSSLGSLGGVAPTGLQQISGAVHLQPQAPGGIQSPAPAQTPPCITAQQLAQMMPQNGMMAPQQLDQLNQQELLQMQMMISQAMQARSQQQRTPAPVQVNPPHNFTPSSFPPRQLAPTGTQSLAAAPGSGTPGAAGRLSTPTEAEASPRAPSPPKEFGDLLAAFHARNPISGIELRAA